MKSKTAFTKKDLIVALCCVVFLIVNIGAIGGSGRRRAKEAVCLSNLRQWGTIFQMYTGDNNGYFPNYVVKYWLVALWGYYGDDLDFLCCPTAKKLTVEDSTLDIDTGDPRTHPGSKLTAWWAIKHPAYCPTVKDDEPFGYGSYGRNDWVDSIPDGLTIYGRSVVGKVWRTPNVEGADNIPLLLDCMWPGSCPERFDNPQIIEDRYNITNMEDDMQRFCLNRHQGAVNGLFVDFSARKVGLKELWLLEWSRKSKKDILVEFPDPPVWPEWMEDFKDYE